jgi:hypothetical protein
MLEIIISAIILISPGDSTHLPFDITIVVDPPKDPNNTHVYIDNIEIEGEKEEYYFYKIIDNIDPGNHSIRITTEAEELVSSFKVMSKETKLPVKTWGNVSIGLQNYYYRDTLYSIESGPIYGLNMTFLKGDNSLNLSFFHDPDYPSEWYPFINLYGKSYSIEGGYIYPFWNEITIFSSDGFGITGKIDIGNFSISPIFVYSKNFDTLFYEYPRVFYGGKLDFIKNDLHLGFTLFNANDDTTNITGFPLTSPKKSYVFSPQISWEVKDGLELKFLYGYSNGNKDLFADVPVEGTVFEGNIIYNRDFNNVTFGIRKISQDYLTLGNPYLYTGRIETFLSGIYEYGFLYTDFDHNLYSENGNLGFSFVQSFKLKFVDYFSPIFEFNWFRYVEYSDNDYQYGEIGFESNCSDFYLYNIFGVYRNLYSGDEYSYRLSSSLYWYPSVHSIGIGGTVNFHQEEISFDLNLYAYIKLWNLGYLDALYYPSFKNVYDNHSLRIIYEYCF